MSFFKYTSALFILVSSVSSYANESTNSMSESIRSVITETQRIRSSLPEDTSSLELYNNILTGQYDKEAENIDDYKKSQQQSQGKNIESIFGQQGITTKEWSSFLSKNERNEATEQSRLTIFISFSMPAAALEETLRVASQTRATVVISGLKKGTTYLHETQLALKQLIERKKITPEPLVIINPDLFVANNITAVPTMMLINESQQKFFISGSLNYDYLEKESLRYDKPMHLFPPAGTTYSIAEVNLIEEIQQRAQKYDWESAKKQAIAKTWQNFYMASLPESTENKIWYIDPTVKVNNTIQDRNGAVLASAGEMINPLERFSQNLTLIIFDPLYPHQVAWAKQQFNQYSVIGQVMPIAVQLDRAQGWQQLHELRLSFAGKVYLINPAIQERFHITATPSIVTVEERLFKVQQFFIKKQVSEE